VAVDHKDLVFLFYVISNRNDSWSLLNLQNTYLLSSWHVGDAEL